MRQSERPIKKVSLVSNLLSNMLFIHNKKELATLVSDQNASFCWMQESRKAKELKDKREAE